MGSMQPERNGADVEYTYVNQDSGDEPRAPPDAEAGQAGPLRPVVRARRLRRRLRRRHQGPQVAPDPASRPSRSCAISITAARAAARRTPATARACCIQMPHAFLQGDRAQGTAAAAGAGRVRQRARVPAPQPDQAPAARGALRAHRAVRGPDRCSAGAPCRPTTARSARRRRASEPFIRQVFIGRGRALADDMAFERKLYVIRKRAYSEIRTSTIDGAEYWYLCQPFAQDLRLQGDAAHRAADAVLHRSAASGDGDGAGAGALALQHQHLPELGPRAPLPLSRAQRRDQHAARQHQLDAGARGAVRVGAVRRGHEEDPADRQSRTAATRRCSTTRWSCWCSRAARCRTR